MKLLVLVIALTLTGCSQPDGTIEVEGLFCAKPMLQYDLGEGAEALIRECSIPISDGTISFRMKDGSSLDYETGDDGRIAVTGVPADEVVSVLFYSKNRRGLKVNNPFHPGRNVLFVGLPVEYCAISIGIDPVQVRVDSPDRYTRINGKVGGFGQWLRQLSVLDGRGKVHLFDDSLKANQDAHYAVLDMDVGEKDLQQCADAVMRLRAEYLLRSGCQDKIQFNFTSGDAAKWSEWRSGIRPVVDGNRVSWSQAAEADSRYENFRKYLDVVFTYAGSASLERELIPVPDPSRPEIGDVFIEGGHPGHAVIVLDVAENEHGERIFLLAQSYMPAQEIHILNSPEEFSPWYTASSEGILRTPEWEFDYTSLRRFPEVDCIR